MANGKFKIDKIVLNEKGISSLLSSDEIKAVVEEAAETQGTIEKEYLSLDRRHHGHRWKCVVKEDKKGGK